MTAPNDDLQNITVAQFLAARAVKMTDDPNQLTLFAYESPEALVLVLRVRRAIINDRKVTTKITGIAPIVEVP